MVEAICSHRGSRRTATELTGNCGNAAGKRSDTPATLVIECMHGGLRLCVLGAGHHDTPVVMFSRHKNVLNIIYYKLQSQWG